MTENSTHIMRYTCIVNSEQTGCSCVSSAIFNLIKNKYLFGVLFSKKMIVKKRLFRFVFIPPKANKFDVLVGERRVATIKKNNSPKTI